ncbi:MAG: AAA family ATPase [Acidimicrobiia bacterium]|nr:AAA family ATPase [Acidimicrobiia bacterium]
MTQYDFSSFEGLDVGQSFEENTFENEHRLAAGAGVAVVDSDQAVRDYLVGLFEGSVDTAFSLEDLEPRLQGGACVVVLGPSCARQEDFDTIALWGKRYPNVAAVLVTSELTTQLLHKALRVGVKDVISAPIDRDQLIATVDRIAENLPSADQLVSFSSGTHLADIDPGEVGRVITVFSTKGGSGKSVTATNLAVSLARRSPKPVVLVDGHLQFGDVAVMLKLHPESTVVDAISQIDVLDADMLDNMIAVHEPSGLKVLAAPVEPSFADQINGQQMARLIDLVRTTAGHVIVDLPAIFNDVVLNVLEASDQIILVAGLDIPNIKNVKIGLSTLAQLNIPNENIHIVLNRSDSKVKLDLAEVERTLGVVAAAHVPSDIVVPISVNKGSPVVLSAPKSGVARAFEQLASVFLDGEAATAGAAPSQGFRKFFG